jgi:hypothetical protein
MEPTECSETSAFNIQTQGKYPEENILATFQPSYHSQPPTCEDGTDSVPKRRLLILICRGNTQKKIYWPLSNQVIIHNQPPVKMEPTECSETSAFNIQTPGKYPEENLPYLQHGESLEPPANRRLIAS